MSFSVENFTLTLPSEQHPPEQVTTDKSAHQWNCKAGKMQIVHFQQGWVHENVCNIYRWLKIAFNSFICTCTSEFLTIVVHIEWIPLMLVIPWLFLYQKHEGLDVLMSIGWILIKSNLSLCGTEIVKNLLWPLMHFHNDHRTPVIANSVNVYSLLWTFNPCRFYFKKSQSPVHIKHSFYIPAKLTTFTLVFIVCMLSRWCIKLKQADVSI